MERVLLPPGSTRRDSLRVERWADVPHEHISVVLFADATHPALRLFILNQVAPSVAVYVLRVPPAIGRTAHLYPPPSFFYPDQR